MNPVSYYCDSFLISVYISVDLVGYVAKVVVASLNSSMSD